MDKQQTGQVISSAAQVYDEFFVPALFAAWPPHLIRAARLQKNARALDVGCGTGVLTKQLAERVGEAGTVVAIDLNEAMLNVAVRTNVNNARKIIWQLGNAENLPFLDDSFDYVFSQFALMFFPDPVKALTEMERVVRPNGRVVLAVWDSLENTPGYAAITGLLDQLFGTAASDAMRAPYKFGDIADINKLLESARINDATILTKIGYAKFPSLKDWLYTDIRGWTLADSIDDVGFNQLCQAGESYLREFVRDDGSVEFPAPAHVITFQK